MRFSDEVIAQLASRVQVMLPHLNERQRRLALAQEARLLGHGGVRAVAQAAGVSETTVRRGVFELEAGGDPLPAGRVRRPGGGRQAAEGKNPQLVPALLGLVEPDERGDPMSPLRWTAKSLRSLAGELTRQGHPVSAPTVAGCCASTGSASRPTPRRWRAGSTLTGMPSSGISTRRPGGTGRPGSR
jgi:Rhodopirellula transposase DDE domain